jgi:hypothetical protein
MGKPVILDDTIPLLEVTTGATERSRATKCNQERQHIFRSVSQSLPDICRHLPRYDIGSCRPMLRFAAVATLVNAIWINSTTIPLNAPTTR